MLGAEEDCFLGVSSHIPTEAGLCMQALAHVGGTLTTVGAYRLQSRAFHPLGDPERISIYLRDAKSVRGHPQGSQGSQRRVSGQ
jgi:hypothetical protein